MKDFRTACSNFVFSLVEAWDKLLKTFLHVLATFLIWFVTVFAIGLGIIASLKILFIVMGN